MHVGAWLHDNRAEDFMKTLLISAALIALAGSALAQDATKVTVIAPDALTWKDNKDNPSILKGVKVAILLGDPTKPGEMVVARVKFPANYQVPPHTHPYAETVTVLSGSLGLGAGEKFEQKGEMLKPGTFYAQPAKSPHYAWTGNEETIIQVQYIGPAGMDYVNRADDPRAASGTSAPAATTGSK
jgi:quercetin dioxygenase-like cupin family protein